jgi:iron complex outermembrane receptor protein
MFFNLFFIKIYTMTFSFKLFVSTAFIYTPVKISNPGRGNMLMMIFLFFSSIIFASNTNDKASLSGKITDKESGTTLPGVSIYFPDLKTGTVSNIDGVYTIDNLPKTKILLQVSLIGYKTIIASIDLNIVTTKDFVMEISAKEIGTVVVTGTSKATEIKNNPVAMVMIDHQFITQNASTNIIETLNKVPGVSTLSTGPNVSKPYIRGLGSNRVLTLFDGVRQEGQQWGEEHGIEVDQYLIDRIEVIKGPASLMYGSDALAGVVNLLPSNPLPEGIIKGNIITDYQTNNKQIAGSFALDGNNKGVVWGMRGSHKQASDYQNKYDGKVYGTKYNENDLNAYVGLNRHWGYSHLNVSVYDNLQEIPDGSRDSASRKFTKQITEDDTIRPIVSNEELNSYSIAVLHQHVQHYRAYSASNFIFGKSKLALNLGVQQSIRREYSHPTYPDLAGLYLQLNVYSYDIKYYLPEKNGWETTVGINGMYQQNKNKGTEFVIPDYHSFDAGPFAHLKKQFGKLDVSGGVRYDVRMFENDSMFTKPNSTTGFDMQTVSNRADTNVVKQFNFYKHTFSGLSASLGASYNMNDKICIKANIARGYRAPNVAEISAKGVHPGTGFEQLGDANFKPEFSLQEDIGVFYNSEHISGSIEVFNNSISNYIYNEKLVSLNGGDSIFMQNGNAFQVFKFRQTAAQLYGGEFNIDIHPHPLDWLHFENSVSVIYAMNLGGNGAIITNSTKYLPYIPPFHTNSELRANIKKKAICFSNIFVKVGVQYYATQNHFYGAYGTETKTNGYTLIDAGAGADVVNKKGNALFTLTILITNLGDIAYQSNMSRLKYFDNYPVNVSGRSGIYNMGRNINFKLTIPLNLKKAAN